MRTKANAHVENELVSHKSRSVYGAPTYISPRELVERWRCSRSSVDRIARQAGLSRICLGSGKNGIVRYLREEVIAYESSRMVVLSAHAQKK